MSQEFISDWWAIRLEPGWFSAKDDECISFWHEDGIGALQIGAYRYDDESIPETALAEFMQNQIPDGIAQEKTQSGEFSGVQVNYIEEGNFWRKLWVTKSSLLVFITYSCDAEDQTIERVSIERMLGSLKARV
jgi:hypothetical protein